MNHSQASVPRSSACRKPVTWSRNFSRLKSSKDTPTTAKFLGSSFALARLKSEGTSLRLVRSPDAPKSTSTHDPAALPICSCFSCQFTDAAVAMWPSPAGFATRKKTTYMLNDIVGHGKFIIII